MDERDGKGRASQNNAKVKQVFKIDLTNAVDVSNMDGATAALNAVQKKLFVDLVQSLTTAGVTADQIPAKIEGLAFGPDVRQGGATVHTLWVANDNDFLSITTDASGNNIPNPNQLSYSVSRMRTWADQSTFRSRWMDSTSKRTICQPVRMKPGRVAIRNDCLPGQGAAPRTPGAMGWG